MLFVPFFCCCCCYIVEKSIYCRKLNKFQLYCNVMTWITFVEIPKQFKSQTFRQNWRLCRFSSFRKYDHLGGRMVILKKTKTKQLTDSSHGKGALETLRSVALLCLKFAILSPTGNDIIRATEVALTLKKKDHSGWFIVACWFESSAFKVKRF